MYIYTCTCTYHYITRRRHFHNMASWFGRPYHGESSSNPVDVRRIVDRARDMIAAMDLTKY